MPEILLLSTSDTDLLSARASGANYRFGNPARLTVEDLPALTDGVDLVVVRILGGRRAWEEGLDALIAGTKPVVILGGEQAPDAELMELSTVPSGVCADAHAYLADLDPDTIDMRTLLIVGSSTTQAHVRKGRDIVFTPRRYPA